MCGGAFEITCLFERFIQTFINWFLQEAQKEQVCFWDFKKVLVTFLLTPIFGYLVHSKSEPRL